MSHPESPATRIDRLEVVIVGVSLLILGLLYKLGAIWLGDVDAGSLIVTLVKFAVVTGCLGFVVDYFTSRAKETANKALLEEVFTSQMPLVVSTVLKGFEIHPDDLRRVATPELLDNLATNAMSLRFGDDQFAREIYADVLDQVIRASGATLMTYRSNSTASLSKYPAIRSTDFRVRFFSPRSIALQ